MSNDPTDLLALARRAVASRGWRWAEGMLTADGGRLAVVTPDAAYIVWRDGRPAGWHRPPLNMLPDINDPATRGCMLALNGVHGSWVHLERIGRKWGLVVPGRVIAVGEHQADALVAGLEAAP